MKTMRRMTGWVPAAVLVVVAAAGVRAESPAELGVRIERLAGELGADTLRVRAAAERELLDLGPAVLPHLPPPELLPNATARQAVRRIRVRLERTKSQESVRAGRVTLEGEFAVGDVLKAVAEQTGNRLDFSALPDDVRKRTLTVEYRDTEFWPVMDDLAERGSLVWTHDVPGTLRLAARAEDDPPTEPAVAYAGAFRVAAESAELRPLAGNQEQRLLRVRFRLMAEPRLRPLFLKYAAADIAAAGPGGPTLPPFTPAASYELPLGEGGTRLAFQMDYLVPAALELPRVVLRGRVTMQTAAGTEAVVIDKLGSARGTARRRGGVTVALRDVRFRETDESGQTARVGVVVSYDAGGPAFESHRTWVFHNQAYLEASDGRRIDREPAFTTHRQTDGAVSVEYAFAGLTDDPDTYRFVYLAPTLVIDVPIAFELTLPVSPP